MKTTLVGALSCVLVAYLGVGCVPVILDSIGSGGSSGTTGGPVTSTGGSGGAPCATAVTGGVGGAYPGPVTTSAVSTGSGPVGGDFVNDGYVSVGPWMGRGFTASDSLGEGTVVTPSCPADGSGCVPAFTGHDFCMHGKVGLDRLYSGYAMLGWELNQSAAPGSPPGNWTVPASGGVTVSYTNPLAVPQVRMTLQIPNGDTGSFDFYCAEAISGKPLLWSDFRTECWNSPSDTMSVQLAPGTQIQSASLIVPGLNNMDIPFDICITDIVVQ